jgi:hypothetical protein
MKENKISGAILSIALSTLGSTSSAAMISSDLDRSTSDIQTTRTLKPGSEFEALYTGEGAIQLDTHAIPYSSADLNGDVVVNSLDISRLSSCFGQNPLMNNDCKVADVDADGDIDREDFSFVSARLGEAYPGNLYPSHSVHYRSEEMVWSIALGDVNGDDFLDMAIVDVDYSHGCRLIVLLGDGAGDFQEHWGFGMEASIQKVVFDDVNSDGFLDLVLATHTGVQVRFGNGDGSFQEELDVVSVPYYTYGDRYSMVLGDVNKDGASDLVLAFEHWGSDLDMDISNAIVVLGNGDGSFQTPQELHINGGKALLDDINNDGTLDLAIVNGDGISLSLGKGDGTFQAPQLLESGGDNILLGDLNGDNVSDLLVTRNDMVSVRLNNGDGNFQTPQSFPLDHDPGPADLSDLNGDGIQDLVGSSGVVLLSKGDGSFQAPLLTGIWLVENSSMVFGDVNNDSHLDLARFSRTGGTSVLLGNGDGSFQALRQFAVGDGPGSVALGDMNHDGNLDIAVANARSNDVSVLLGNGKGYFQEAQSFTAGDNPKSVKLGDLNGDGVLDLAVANESSVDVSVLLGNGDGSFQSQQRYMAGHLPRQLFLDDLNSDGVIDLVVINEYYELDNPKDTDVSVLLGNGDGSFQTQQRYIVGESSSYVDLGDANGDSVVDLVVCGALWSSGCHSLLGNGDGSFQTSQRPAVDVTPDPVDVSMDGSPRGLLALGDMNGDGILDTAQTDKVQLGQGDGTFPVVQHIATEYQLHSVILGDLNNDNALDLVAFGEGSTISLLLGNGDGGTITQQHFLAVGSAWTLGDLNNDGRLDLVGVNAQSNSVTILLNRGNNR